MTISQILVRRLISRIVSYVLVSYTNQLKNSEKIILVDILQATLIVREWLKQ